MVVIGTNQSKNIVSPTGGRKSGIYVWGDTQANWGDPIATWGGLLIVPSNQSKNTLSGTNQSKS